MSEANWYVVHTYSGYENKVKANIEKTIENRHLENEILEENVPEGARYVATDNYVGYMQTINAARTGYTAKLWKIIYENGEEVSREQVNLSYYNSAKRVVGVGTKTNDEALKNKIINAIATQNEETIKKAVFGGDEEEQQPQQQPQTPQEQQTQQ